MGVVNHVFSSLFCGGGKRGTMDQFSAEQVRSWIRRLSTYGITARYLFATASVGIATVAQFGPVTT
jgi:hypothetical protein